jgi:hypothetical protein
MPTLVVRNADGSTGGADPRRIGRAALEAAGFAAAPLLKVIRAKCLDCSYHQPAEIARCTAIGCALWPYRMGKNVFTNRKGRDGLAGKSSAVLRNSDGSPLPDGEHPPAHPLKKPTAGLDDSGSQGLSHE